MILRGCIESADRRPQRVYEQGPAEGKGTGSESSRCLSPFPATSPGPAKRPLLGLAVPSRTPFRAYFRSNLGGTLGPSPSGADRTRIRTRDGTPGHSDGFTIMECNAI